MLELVAYINTSGRPSTVLYEVPYKSYTRLYKSVHVGFRVFSYIYIDGDQGTTSKDLVQVPIGPITRARAKKFKDVLNGLIQELWAQANSWRPIEHDPRGQQRIVTLIQVLEGSGQG
jgi:hypothetical protein